MPMILGAVEIELLDYPHPNLNLEGKRNAAVILINRPRVISEIVLPSSSSSSSLSSSSQDSCRNHSFGNTNITFSCSSTGSFSYSAYTVVLKNDRVSEEYPKVMCLPNPSPPIITLIFTHIT